MKRPRALAITFLALGACGLTNGCDLAVLEDAIRDGFVEGVKTKVGTIPGLIVDPILAALGLGSV